MPLFRVPTQNATQYTLDAQLAAGGTTLTLNQSVAGIVRAPGVCWIDRVDSNGNATASKREYMTFTGVSSAQLTGLTRGLAGSTDQVHAVSAIVEFGPDVIKDQEDYRVFTTEHDDQNGVHASLPSLSVINVNTLISASGASINAFPVRPVWVFQGTSAASTSIGKPVPMPESGTIQFVAVTLNGPVSGASLLFDINKNFTSIFDAGTRPTILGGGTYVSTASIATKIFSRSDFLSVDLDAGGTFDGATVEVSAR